jgi:hypothetical protein
VKRFPRNPLFGPGVAGSRRAREGEFQGRLRCRYECFSWICGCGKAGEVPVFFSSRGRGLARRLLLSLASSRLACNAHWTGPMEDAFISGIEKDEGTE